jgi:hypothetical protein
MLAHSNGPNAKFPRISCRAKDVLEKLKISKAIKAHKMITPKINPLFVAALRSRGVMLKEIERFM